MSVAAPKALRSTGRRVELEVDARVCLRKDLATGIVGLSLVRADGLLWPEWQPGAHVDVILPDGLVRQYSLCGSPRDRERIEIAVLREENGRGGSRWIHEHLVEGVGVRVRGPRNHFPLRRASHLLFIAGGIGITPILPMIEQADAAEWDWRLLYCGRARSGMAFAADLAEAGDRVSVHPRDEGPRVDLEKAIRAAAPGTQVYACGPATLLDAVEAAASGVGLEPVVTERFEPLSVDASNDIPFEVEISSDGRVLEVPAGASILHVLRENGINVIASCEEGTCGTCETGVLAGEPDHRDAVLTAAEKAENNYMMVCCSRSRSARLVLDL